MKSPFQVLYKLGRKRNKDKGISENSSNLRKAPFPSGLSHNDEVVLTEVRERAYKLDQYFGCCCGFRFGWSSVVGFLPVIGDAWEVYLSMTVIRKASRVDGGLPKRMYSLMLFYIALDFAIGFIPILGDLVDMGYRANTRNAWLLDAYLDEKAKALRRGVIVDPDDGEKIAVPSEMHGDVERAMGGEKTVNTADGGIVHATPTLNPAMRLESASRRETGTLVPSESGRMRVDPRSDQPRQGRR